VLSVSQTLRHLSGESLCFHMTDQRDLVTQRGDTPWNFSVVAGNATLASPLAALVLGLFSRESLSLCPTYDGSGFHQIVSHQLLVYSSTSE
jgi:hypothetical protein